MFNKLFSESKGKPETTHKHRKIKKHKNELKARIDSNLSGSKFRILNELLYVNPSSFAHDHFRHNPEDFEIVRI
jgi:hypothetical protein